MTVTVHHGDCLAILPALPAESVHCVVTSPPYWGLRDYGVAGQLGLEPTPQEHVARMVEVFSAVRRVLRKDGVCWVNYGDSYATSVNGRSAADTKAAGTDDRTFRDKPFSTVTRVGTSGNKGNVAADGLKRNTADGVILKAKDCCNIPERFLLAMQADGWWVRSKLPWVKRNGMPESIADRPAVSIEWVFMFTRAGRYWYDADAVMKPTSPNTNLRVSQDVAKQIGSYRASGGTKANGPMKAVVRTRKLQPAGSGIRSNTSFENACAGPAGDDRNFRNSDLFWPSLIAPLGLISNDDGTPLALDVPPQSFRQAHFATFPPKLIEPLILAGCPQGGVVLDPFGGAGTTGLVADRLQRDAILIELNPEYASMARRRITGDAPLLTAAE